MNARSQLGSFRGVRQNLSWLFQFAKSASPQTATNAVQKEKHLWWWWWRWWCEGVGKNKNDSNGYFVWVRDVTCRRQKYFKSVAKIYNLHTRIPPNCKVSPDCNAWRLNPILRDSIFSASFGQFEKTQRNGQINLNNAEGLNLRGCHFLRTSNAFNAYGCTGVVEGVNRSDKHLQSRDKLGVLVRHVLETVVLHF